MNRNYSKHVCNLLAIVVSFCFIEGKAQDQITFEWRPMGNERIQNAVLQDNNLGPGDAGVNINWDFGSINQNDAVLIEPFEYVEANTTKYFSEFQNALVAIRPVDTLSEGRHQYFQINTTEFNLLGSRNFNMITRYNNPEQLISFPLDFEGQFEDDFDGQFYTINQESLATFFSGSITATYDAIGTLITPEGTFEDVIRIRTERIVVDSNTTADVTSLFTTTATVYTWYQGSIGNIIASLSISKTDTEVIIGGFSSQKSEGVETRTFTWMSSGLTTSASEFSFPNSFAAYPNPVQESLTIEFTGFCNCEGRIEVLNHLGQVMSRNTIKLQTGQQMQLNLQFADYSEGYYLLRVESPQERWVKNIIKTD